MPPSVVSSFFQQLQPTPIQYLTTINQRRLFIKRDDMNHPVIQGNKLRKLKYTLQLAESNQHTIVSFGGAYSNHIAALAAAGKEFSIPTVGIIRGQELRDEKRWSSTLTTAYHNGMRLHFVDRQTYRDKEHNPVVDAILARYDNPLLVPEGGSNDLAVKGCSEIIDEIASDMTEQQTGEKVCFNRIFAACGTGGTLAGLIDGVAFNASSGFSGLANCDVVGVPVLKGADFLIDDIQRLRSDELRGDKSHVNWELLLNYHCGGYAQVTEELLAFMTDFENTTGILTDPVYTAKLLFAVYHEAQCAPLCLAHAMNTSRPENWLVYHSGGIQGRMD